MEILKESVPPYSTDYPLKMNFVNQAHPRHTLQRKRKKSKLLYWRIEEWESYIVEVIGTSFGNVQRMLVKEKGLCALNIENVNWRAKKNDISKDNLKKCQANQEIVVCYKLLLHSLSNKIARDHPEEKARQTANWSAVSARQCSGWQGCGLDDCISRNEIRTARPPTLSTRSSPR